MVVELMGYANMNEQMALHEGAPAGLKSMDHLIRLVSHQQHHNPQLDNTEITYFTISKFKKVISILNRTGHARFRRALVQPPPLTSFTFVEYQNLASGSSQMPQVSKSIYVYPPFSASPTIPSGVENTVILPASGFRSMMCTLGELKKTGSKATLRRRWPSFPTCSWDGPTTSVELGIRRYVFCPFGAFAMSV
ncbi:WRKY domain-containing protein [Forsythia ovata]|uniref:WRKY domain-containing protein n=1 Tax=Forsythia ovata TaxID=205694 RepID=A0ABD1NZ18_9LAMI